MNEFINSESIKLSNNKVTLELFGLNATITKFVIVLYCIALHCFVLYCIALYCFVVCYIRVIYKHL